MSKDKKGKQIKQPKETRSNDGLVPELPRTAFNFIAASWASKRKKRYSNVAASCVVVVVMTALVLAGIWAGSGNTALKSRAATAQATRTSVEQQIGSITGGVVNIDGHETVRKQEIHDIYGKDVDTSFVMTQLLLHTPASIRITDLTITGPSGVPLVPADGVPVSTAPDDTGPPTTVPAGPTFKIVVVAVSTDFKAAEEWRSMLSLPDSPFVASDPVISGSAEQLTLNLSATLVDSDVLTELARINNQVGWQDSQTEAPTTSAGEG